MAVSFARVRQLAGAFPGVSEALCYGIPTRYAGKRILARLWEDGETLVCGKVGEVPASRSGCLFLPDHYRKFPMMLVYLSSVEQPALHPLIEQAWRMVAPARQRIAYDNACQQGNYKGAIRAQEY